MRVLRYLPIGLVVLGTISAVTHATTLVRAKVAPATVKVAVPGPRLTVAPSPLPVVPTTPLPIVVASPIPDPVTCPAEGSVTATYTSVLSGDANALSIPTTTAQ